MAKGKQFYFLFNPTSIFLLFLFFSNIHISSAAEIYQNVLDSGEPGGTITIEGTIESGDYQKFIEVVRRSTGKASHVSILSPGGDFEEAMKIGRALRSLELISEVPSRNNSGEPMCLGLFFGPQPPRNPNNCTCASACFFIHIGSIWRQGSFLLVNRPYFSKGQFGEMPEDQAKLLFDELQNNAQSYMQEMGVPPHIQENVLGASSDKSLLLDQGDIDVYFSGEIPHRKEWLLNKCKSFNKSEEEELEWLTNMGHYRAGVPTVSIPKSLQDRVSELIKKQSNELDCFISTRKKLRQKAYNDFFKK